MVNGPYDVIARWSPPSPTNGMITGYNLYVDFRNGTSTVIMVEPTATEYNLDNLSPYQEVYMSATARTAVGEGPNTTVATARTDQTRKMLFVVVVIIYKRGSC